MTSSSAAILTSLPSNTGTKGDEKSVPAGTTDPLPGLLKLKSIPLEVVAKEFVCYESPHTSGGRRRRPKEHNLIEVKNSSISKLQSLPPILTEMFGAVCPDLLKKIHIIAIRAEAEKILTDDQLRSDVKNLLLRFNVAVGSVTNDLLVLSAKDEGYNDNDIFHDPITDGFMDLPKVRMSLDEFKTTQPKIALNPQELNNSLRSIISYFTDKIILPLIAQKKCSNETLKVVTKLKEFLCSLKPLYFFLSGRALLKELETNLNANTLVTLRFWVYGLIKLGGAHPALAHLAGMLQNTILPSIEIMLGKVKKESDAKTEEVPLNANHALLIQSVYHYILNEDERNKYAIPALRQLTCSYREKVAIFTAAIYRLGWQGIAYPSDAGSDLNLMEQTIMQRLNSIYVKLLTDDKSYYFAVKESIAEYVKAGGQYSDARYLFESACGLLGRIKLEFNIQMKTDFCLAFKDRSEKNNSYLRYQPGSGLGPFKFLFQLLDDDAKKGILGDENSLNKRI